LELLLVSKYRQVCQEHIYCSAYKAHKGPGSQNRNDVQHTLLLASESFSTFWMINLGSNSTAVYPVKKMCVVHDHGAETGEET